MAGLARLKTKGIALNLLSVIVRGLWKWGTPFFLHLPPHTFTFRVINPPTYHLMFHMCQTCLFLFFLSQESHCLSGKKFPEKEENNLIKEINFNVPTIIPEPSWYVLIFKRWRKIIHVHIFILRVLWKIASAFSKKSGSLGELYPISFYEGESLRIVSFFLLLFKNLSFVSLNSFKCSISKSHQRYFSNIHFEMSPS